MNIAELAWEPWGSEWLEASIELPNNLITIHHLTAESRYFIYSRHGQWDVSEPLMVQCIINDLLAKHPQE